MKIEFMNTFLISFINRTLDIFNRAAYIFFHYILLLYTSIEINI